MNGNIKKIKDTFPVTTTKAVYIDGTDRTLQEAIDNGEIGSNIVTTTSNFVTDACFYVNDVIFSKDVNGNITVNLNKSLTLNRILRIFWSGGGCSNVNFPDGTIIPVNTSLIWDSVNNFQITTDAYNSIKIPYNGILVGANVDGRIVAGVLSSIWDKYFPYYNKPRFGRVYNVNAELVTKATNTTLHCMYVCNDKLITLECWTSDGVWNGASHVYSLPDLKHEKTFYNNLQGTKSDGNPINLRLVTADYNHENKCLILGSGTADGSDAGSEQGYIFYDAENWPNYTDPVTFENTPHTVLDLYSEGLFGNIVTPKLIWSELPDMIYLTCNNLQYCYKLLLGTGTNQLEHGIYNYDENKRYNGTYKILETYSQSPQGVGNKDVQLYNGCLYYPVKYTSGGYRIYKSYLTPSGTIESDLIVYNPVDKNGVSTCMGSPEGCVIYDGKLIGAHATYGYFYIFDISNLN